MPRLLATFRLFILLACLSGTSQDAFVQTPRPIPDRYASSAKVNYVRTWVPNAPIADPAVLNSRPLEDVRQSTSYLDGLGKVLQVVNRQGSLKTGQPAKDFVQLFEYDANWNTPYTYLPFAANTAGGNISSNDGLFKDNPFEQQAAFYQSKLAGQNETFYYGKTDLDGSPLKQVLKTYLPGNNWVGNSKGTTMQYGPNIAEEHVQMWSVSGNSIISSGDYPAGHLSKILITDANGNKSVEYKDKEGHIILTKKQLVTNPSQHHDGWACNYLVYDNKGNQVLSIQPKAVDLLLLNGWQLTSTILDELCFKYEYDKRNRLVIKKIPGAGETWMVYDARDRMVLSQDASQRSTGNWLYFQYDELNRQTTTGIWTNGQNREYHSAQAAASTQYPNLSGQTIEELATNFYDNYLWLGNYTLPFTSNRITSYDNYLSPASNQWPYAQAVQQSLNLNGLLTGTRKKVLGSSKYLYSITYYDEDANVIQEQSTNITDGLDIAVTQYTYKGQPLVHVLAEQLNGASNQSNIVVTSIGYDQLGRLLTLKKTASHTLNGVTVSKPEQTVSETSYNELGEVAQKKLSPAYNSGNGLETINLDYNIHGKLLGINRDYLQDGANALSHYFAFELGYDKSNTSASSGSFLKPRLDGFIGGTLWKSQGDGTRRKFDYDYDAAGRILKADFRQEETGAWSNSSLDFSVKMGNGTDPLTAYDANGNIIGMLQRGWKPGGSADIDNLTYSYLNNGNRLLAVSDGISGDNKSGDFTDKNTSQDDYAYDVNGNLVSDKNKRVVSISYNHLNLPQVVTVNNDNGTSRGTITYTYDARGTKLRKTLVEGNNKTVTTYVGPMIYQYRCPVAETAPDTLQFIAIEDGRLRFVQAESPTPAKFEYDYFLKDHLGNIRMVLTEETKQDAYPALSFEGTAGTPEVQNQDTYWENKNGQSINVNSVRTTRPGAFGTSATNGSSVILVRKSQGGIGGAKLLKVMAGDRLHTSVDYYYTVANANNSPAGGILSLVGSFVSALSGSSAPNGLLKNGASSITSSLQSNTDLINLLNTPNNTDGSNQAPKAYLNILLFDDQFNFDKNNSVVVPVAYMPNQRNVLSRMAGNAVTAQKNGYAYVYFSNESDEFVYFDNFMLTQEHGRILEETHYSVWGGILAAISSKTLGRIENKYKFNEGTELDNDLDLGWYETEHRLYDPQIGRFLQMDEMAEGLEEWSPYTFASDNPINFNDPLGLLPDDPADPDKPVTTRTTNLPAVYVYGTISGWKLYMNRLKLGAKRGIKGPAYYDTDGENIRRKVEAWNGFENRRAEMTREMDMFVLETASWFIPVGTIFKFAKIGRLVRLVRFKRGVKVAETVVEEVVEQTVAHTDEVVKGTGRVFWSGGEAVMKEAASYAEARGLTTLEMTRAGQNLTKLTKDMPWEQAGPMWERLSAVYAKGANGTVHVFQNASTGVRLKSVWKTVEYPILKGKNFLDYHNVFVP